MGLKMNRVLYPVLMTAGGAVIGAWVGQRLGGSGPGHFGAIGALLGGAYGARGSILLDMSRGETSASTELAGFGAYGGCGNCGGATGCPRPSYGASVPGFDVACDGLPKTTKNPKYFTKDGLYMGPAGVSQATIYPLNPAYVECRADQGIYVRYQSAGWSSAPGGTLRVVESPMSTPTETLVQAEVALPTLAKVGEGLEDVAGKVGVPVWAMVGGLGLLIGLALK